MFAWTMGDGPFIASVVTEGLVLRPDPEDDCHGFVEPGVVMQVQDYRAALEATSDKWGVDERTDP